MDSQADADHVSPPLRTASSGLRRGIRRKPLSYQRLPSVDETTVRRSNSGASQRPLSPEATSFRESVTEAFGLGIRESNDMSQKSSIETIRGIPDRSASPQVGPALTGTQHSTEPQLNYRISQLSFQKDMPDQIEAEESQTESSLTPPVVEVPLEAGNHKGFDCPSKRNVIQRRSSWLSIAILVLAFYATAMSGLYLTVACMKLRYGRRIGGDGLVPSTATLLSALFAKTIELSFVTVFVAFLGQVLSRRALAKNAGGLTIADMSMRAWVMQPGTLITHWENVKHSALTVLGMIALTTTFVAMLYTTAAEALVSPKLAFSGDQETSLNGLVRQKFAAVEPIIKQCQIPISSDIDENSQINCMQVSSTGQSYHNFEQFLTNWVEAVDKGTPGKLMSERPLPVGTWYDNTTVEGSWVEQHDMAQLSEKYGRMIENVTAVMPHAGVFAASRFPRNDIRQPEDLGGQGEFEIKAAAASPAVNVICAGMTAEELEPLVYDAWPHRAKGNGSPGWVTDLPNDLPHHPAWQNRTVVDDIFGWGGKGTYDQRRPIFPKIPIPYNTILNASIDFAQSLYVLGTVPPHVQSPPHFLCALRGGLASMCSTRYHATASSGELKAHCDDPEDDLVYFRNVEGEAPPALAFDADFRTLAQEWSKAIGLGAGAVDSNATSVRILTGLVSVADPKTNISSLSQKSPSIAEALAVMAGTILMQATHETPFKHYWNPPEPTPFVDQVSARIRSSDYFSGGSQRWQGVFYVVLVLVFITSLVCLVYMYLDFRGVQLTDFTEPQNAFVLALNSPGSRRVRGACGGGPEGKQLTQRWVITMDERDEHYYITTKGERDGLDSRYGDTYGNGYSDSPELRNMLSPKVEEYRRLSSNRNSVSLLIK